MIRIEMPVSKRKMLELKNKAMADELTALNNEHRALREEREMAREMMSREKDLRAKAQKEKSFWKGVAILMIAVAALLMATIVVSMKADAETVNRYTTQTVSLREKAGGKVVKKVGRNTKVAQIRTGKRWAVVKYKGKKYVTLKKYLNPERLPGKKKSRECIKYLKTRGPVHWHGRKYTYYTSRLCPIYKLPVPGLHLDADGIWCDKNDYIVLGSSVALKQARAIVATPFGKYGKVYDTGGYSTPPTLCDTAVNW